ncbi:MAG: DUF3857 domain-containing protein [Bacteroidetes bacterium]|nr:DUF3857 domain-containing protein [Bacteroidota bacterium]
MKSHLTRILFALSAVLCGLTGISQPVLNLEHYQKTFPNKPFVYLYKSLEYNIQVKENKPIITSKHKEQRLFLNETAKSYDTKKISTSEFIEIKNVKACVYVPDGKKYKKLEVTDISLKEEGSDDTFYDGEKQYIIKFPSTLPGNILELEYDVVYNEPRFFGSAFLSDYFPIVKSTINMRFPANMQLDIRDFNFQNLKSDVQRSAKKTDSLITWVYDTIQPLPLVDYSPNLKWYASYKLFKINTFVNSKGETVPLLRNNDDLYSWYKDLLKNLNKTHDTELKGLVDSVTAGATTEIDKLQKIFSWVQDKIAYVAYEDGLGGYIPREATVICSRRFGDCKDMASLIVKMSHLAGINVYHAWIGTRDIPYVYSEFSAPVCANHMIAAYEYDGKYIFLDATSKLNVFGMPTSMIQGKEAFVGINDSEYRLLKVPVIDQSLNYVDDSLICSIRNKDLKGFGYFKADGYSKVSILSRLDGKSPKELKDYMSALLNKGNNKFTLDSFSVVQKSKYAPLLIYYTFTLPDYATVTDKGTFVNLNFDKDYLKDLKTTDRTVPLEFDYCFSKKLRVQLNIQDSEKGDFIPPDSQDKNDISWYTSSYKSAPGNIRFTNDVHVNSMMIDVAKLPTFNTFINNYTRTTNKSLYITKK